MNFVMVENRDRWLELDLRRARCLCMNIRRDQFDLL